MINSQKLFLHSQKETQDKNNFSKARILNQLVDEGQQIKCGDTLLKYEILQSTEQAQNDVPSYNPSENFIADKDAKLKEILIPELDIFDYTKEPVCCIDYCSHGLQMNGLCVDCGKDLLDELDSTIKFKGKEIESTSSQSRKRRGVDSSSLCKKGSTFTKIQKEKVRQYDLVVGRNMKLQMSEKMLKQQILDNTFDLLRHEKLLLILDLDHTLIQSSRNLRVEKLLHIEKYKNELFKIVLTEDSRRRTYFIKLRPGVREFISKASQLFDIRVYTMGLRHYAEQILDFIDPEHKYIGKRVVCRDDHSSKSSLNFRPSQKAYKSSRLDDEALLGKDYRRLFPVDERFLLVVDDRSDVQPSNIQRNVVQVPKYDFFGGCAINREKEFDSKALRDFEVRDRDNVLETVWQVVSAVHKLFYLFDTQEYGDKSLSEDIGDRKMDVENKGTLKKYKNNNFIPDKVKANENKKEEDEDEEKMLELDSVIEDALEEVFEPELVEKESQKIKNFKNQALKSKISPQKLRTTISGSSQWKDTRQLLTAIRKTVLKNTTLIFSSCFPLNVNPHSTLEQKMARSCGAQCSRKLSSENLESVTHLVVDVQRFDPDRTTQKITLAKTIPEIKIVNRFQLDHTYNHQSKADESLFKLKIGNSKQTSNIKSNGSINKQPLKCQSDRMAKCEDFVSLVRLHIECVEHQFEDESTEIVLNKDEKMIEEEAETKCKVIEEQNSGDTFGEKNGLDKDDQKVFDDDDLCKDLLMAAKEDEELVDTAKLRKKNFDKDQDFDSNFSSNIHEKNSEIEEISFNEASDESLMSSLFNQDYNESSESNIEISDDD